MVFELVEKALRLRGELSRVTYVGKIVVQVLNSNVRVIT